MNRILKNSIRCKKCGDVIESKRTHQFVWCKCGSCAVDGGHAYLKRAWRPDKDKEDNNPEDYFEELSTYEETVERSIKDVKTDGE